MSNETPHLAANGTIGSGNDGTEPRATTRPDAAVLAAVRAAEGRPGRYWGRAETLDPADPEDARIAQDETAALEHAMRVLDRLLDQAARYRDPGRRSRALSAIDRALADPASGYLLRLREARTAAVQARVDGGEGTALIARDLGIGQRRVNALLDHNRSYVSEERRAALALLAQERAAAAAERRSAREAAKAAARASATAFRLEQGRAFLPRFEAGEPATKLAGEAGVSRQVLTSWLRAARAERDATDRPGAIGG